ncbi:sensor histidine kinase [Nocardiopsis listeri]|uniref:sensor histidine kinase n=1 Tax=Nocardiopsis listeri TaxID=53440 RepID=UPI00082ACD28|nr:HAMP domain-containing sensor histidine kinase [Nocardiopsis listeri]
MTRGRLRPTGLKARLILTVLCLTTVGLIAFGTAASLLLHRSLVEEVDHRLMELSRGPVPGPPPPQETERTPPLPTDLRRIVLDTDGEVVSSLGQTENDPGGPDLDDTGAQTLRGRAGEPFDLPDSAGEGSWRVLATEHRDGTLDVLAQSLDAVDGTLSRLVLIECAVGAVLLVVLGVGAVAIVHGQLRPLRRIEGTAQEIAAGDFQRRVPEGDTSTETGRMAVALNTMLEQLSRALHERDRSVATTKRFVADASHELRTPLSSIRGFAELYRQGRERGVVAQDARTERWMSRIEGEAMRMSRMVDDLLTLSRFDEEPVLDRSDVDLTELADHVVRAARVRDPERSIDLCAPPAVSVPGDRARLTQVVENLLDNALTHTPDGTHVRVEVTRTKEAGGTAVLSVSDEGPGIPEEELPHIFGRFYQVGGTGHRHGSGLGLAISTSFVAAHGGRLTVESGQGQGTTFRVVLPLN